MDCPVCHLPREGEQSRCGGCENECAICGLKHRQPMAWAGRADTAVQLICCVRAMAIKLGFAQPREVVF